MEPVGPGKPRRANSAGEWDRFDPDAYYELNYSALRADDRQILEGVRAYFATFAAAAAAERPLSGLDVGSGSNLYPTLSMLPWCDQITLVEFGASNVAWLEKEIKAYGATWDEFWDVLCQEPAYGAVEDPRRLLAERATVSQGSVFELDRARWEIGTMFFVACSISEKEDEFRRASECFLNALVPGAPFAMAYMEKSEGYRVRDVAFPAVSLDMTQIQDSLDGLATDLKVNRIVVAELLREGYEAMVLVCGRTRREPVPGARIPD
ncbi:SCO2525 family SAM-dependent methyltransferase [Parafrankia sp. FMc2]|uniref:SCO2525 family SAM-dependent methyltransferase n=1 Tax=Parafrankia sp. FMc2 TaxID=3233196 RepID=UPI0034D62D81